MISAMKKVEIELAKKKQDKEKDLHCVCVGGGSRRTPIKTVTTGFL